LNEQSALLFGVTIVEHDAAMLAVEFRTHQFLRPGNCRIISESSPLRPLPATRAKHEIRLHALRWSVKRFAQLE
jgi:hypothetical protein